MISVVDAKLRMVEMVHNAFDSVRSTLAKALKSANVDLLRDIDEQCGYPTDIDVEQFKYLYEREGIATRVVSIYPEECWGTEPEVLENEDEKETDFEADWRKLAKRLSIFEDFEQVDEISGIGRYGVLFIGFDDKKPLENPVQKREGLRINYLRGFSEPLATIEKFDTDPKSERFGLPEIYKLKIADPSNSSNSPAGSEVLKEHRVHYSRCIHIADNLKGEKVYGVPRLQKVFNRAIDLRKILGGSAEMLWKGGFPGLAFEVDPKALADGEIDRKALRKEMKDYMDGLERYLATVGVSVKSLSTNVADPMNHAMLQLKVIAICLGIPWRIFAGSEEAKLASQEDKNNWHRRIEKRQKRFCCGHIIKPFIERIVELGVISSPKDIEEVIYKFEPLNKRTEMEKAEYAEKATKALASYIGGGVDQMIPEEQYLNHFLELDNEVVKAIIKAMEKIIREEDEDDEEESEEINPIGDEEDDDEQEGDETDN